MGAELSLSTENGKTVVAATGNDFKYWEIEKIPVIKEWAKSKKLLTGSNEVMEGDKKKKVWTVSAIFDTVKEAKEFIAEVKKVKEYYLTFERNIKSLTTSEEEVKPVKVKKTPAKTENESPIVAQETKKVEVISI